MLHDLRETLCKLAPVIELNTIILSFNALSTPTTAMWAPSAVTTARRKATPVIMRNGNSKLNWTTPSGIEQMCH